MVGQMNATVRLLALSGLRSRYPNDLPDKLRRRLADFLLGKELANKVYGVLEDDVVLQINLGKSSRNHP